jgi:hypothetical protein
MNTLTKTNGRHPNGASRGNGNGHAVLTETIPIVQVSSPDSRETSVLDDVTHVPDRERAPAAESMPCGSPEGRIRTGAGKCFHGLVRTLSRAHAGT